MKAVVCFLLIFPAIQPRHQSFHRESTKFFDVVDSSNINHEESKYLLSESYHKWGQNNNYSSDESPLLKYNYEAQDLVSIGHFMSWVQFYPPPIPVNSLRIASRIQKIKGVRKDLSFICAVQCLVQYQALASKVYKF